MQSPTPSLNRLSPEAAAFYRQAIDILNQSGIPFLIGGAYALQPLTGIVRHTKDLDVFVYPHDCQRTLDLFSRKGHHVELTFPHWLGKIHSPEGDFIDLIFASGNGVAGVDEDWFKYALRDQFLDKAVRLCPVEETIWSKSFIMERNVLMGPILLTYSAHEAGASIGHGSCAGSLGMNRSCWYT